MEISSLTRNIIALCVTAAVSSGITYWYCTSQNEERLLALEDKITTLEANERRAIVTQRISEQMEDIAYQSKRIADTARQKAEFESRIAMEQAHRADEERRHALLAKDQADKAEGVAREQEAKAKIESQRAVEQAQRAEYERAKADTLKYISLGHALAQTSLTQFNAGNSELADLLALTSYKYTTQYGGNPYEQDVFTSLLDAAGNARNKMGKFIGNVRAVQCVNVPGRTAPDDDVVAVTDYGEVVRLATAFHENGRWKGYNCTKLYSDDKYMFCDLCIRDSIAYILDVNGRLVLININKEGKQNPTVISVASTARDSERWQRLLKKKNGNLIAVGEHQLSWIDTKTQEVYRQRYIDEDITESGIGDGKLLVFTKQEKYYVFREGEPAEWPLELPIHTSVTSYYYHKGKQLHAIGTDDGCIYFYNNYGVKVAEFTGHMGPVTHMDYYSWLFVTSSYDKTIRIWNLDQIGGLVVPIEVKCNSWPLAFDIDEGAKALRVGYANGEMESIRISVEDNAASIIRYMKRDFTKEEWQYYIGKDEPYRTYMNK